ncbi:MAG: aldehyde dehydrogenase family protein [Fimbriimonadaceae bacterium]|nr:MAG: aldehyde dehydrogenase family protein [Fimbriimonadaceae bacterium]
MPLDLAHFIANEPFPAHDGAFTDSINPSNPGETVARSPKGGAEAVDRAVAAAGEAFRKSCKTPGPVRGNWLSAWAEAIAARQEELAQAVAREVGKPIGEARGEAGRCVAILRYFAGESVRPCGQVIPAIAEDSLQVSLDAPLGVVGLITPWNFPLAIPLWKAAPALAFGNTVVLKPSEEAPYCASLLAETALAAGLPQGAFNVVYGLGETTGAALVEHPEVAAVSFTGSESVGRKVAVACAARGAKCQTEMGGKNPAIVFSDADLGLAANLVAAGAMRFAGQKCTATSRVVVEKSVLPSFLEALAKAIDALPIGPVTDAATALGPVVTDESLQRLEAVAAGAAEPVAYRASGQGEGFFFAPTVFRDVQPESVLAQQELFGPVLAVIEACDRDQAIELANASRYGLSASLFTNDLRSAMDYVRRIEAGMVRVNADTTGVDPHAPFGGFKASSSGTREQGPAARAFYTQTKTVQINA